MKSQINFKAIGMFATISLLVFTSSLQTVKAQSSAVTVVAENKPDLQVKYLGASGEYLVFELSMQQADDTRSNLRIRNENGNELYSETMFLRTVVRRFKISRDEAEKLEFVFNTSKAEVKKVVAITIKFQETIEVKDIARL